ncbi:MAG: protein-L-isoaspartate O-methyltransferase [Nevskiales bacterium]|nr:protein-L-isoaspartate O-methyltransferase [Nevskiales bacterium]
MSVHHHARGLGLASPASRKRLIDEVRAWGVKDERVLKALEQVPRHEFLEDALKSRAYENNALPIGLAQTISQPYIVALMTEAVLSEDPRFTAPHPTVGSANGSPLSPLRGVRDVGRPGAAALHRPVQRVLEIGTGSGYQTAVLAELVPVVFTLERLRALSERARRRLHALGYPNIFFSYGDGTAGWSVHAPYDAIVVTAAAEQVPQALLDQLAVGGRMVIPVGPSGSQSLRLIHKQTSGVSSRELSSVSFVPLLAGRA